MTPSLQRKLEVLAERHEEVGRLLADPGVLADNARFRTLSKEYAQLDPVAKSLAEHAQARRNLAATQSLRNICNVRIMLCNQQWLLPMAACSRSRAHEKFQSDPNGGHWQCGAGEVSRASPRAYCCVLCDHWFNETELQT